MSTSEQGTKDIWADSEDVLGRKHVAQYLTNYMTNRYQAKSNENGFVLAIDAEWGFGKTFLLQNWRDELIQAGYAAVYFDAWKNDFTPEPLIAFIAELNENFEPLFVNVPAAKKLFKTARENIARLWKPIALVAAGAGLRLTTGLAVESISEALSDDSPNENKTTQATSKEDLKKSLEKIFDATLKQHESKKKSIEEFRRNMELLISALKNDFQLPLFVFVDELDRCRPNYAIELLEGIKHLFGIQGIYFVVATNIDQLGESTKAIYGSNFDGQRYLKRFFDMEYSLPKPEGIAFARELFQKITVPESHNVITGFNRNSEKEQKSLHFIFCRYADFFNRGLRDQQQIIRIIEAAFLTLATKPIHVHFLFFLTMLYHKSPLVYESVVNSKSLNDTTGYLNLRNSSSNCFFETTVHGDPFENTRTTTRNHSIDEIALMYLRTMEDDLVDISRENINTLDFPQNMRGSLATELANGYYMGTKYPPSIRKYTDIVRQAGGFIAGDKNREIDH